ncbi:sulfotransferase family protein [Frankia nepalensis]|uniref:sulfotransferase family protein n=1 Tax=Frankia nepalensis TaxID=1836974 RepID=UPI001933CF2F|nr:sulfotransferase [Frankia nepalensis]
MTARAGRPAPVEIDDLAEPRFTDEVRSVLAMMADAGRGLALEPDALMDAAARETGLADFGPTDFVERLGVLCRSMREDAGLSDAGVLAQHVLLVGLLKSRLFLEDLVRRHPEILDERITAPIVICGLPRTGTTHLHNLMSADPALRWLPYWESREPVLAPDEAAAVRAGAPDPRPERTARALWLVNAAMPYFNRMHEMTVDHAHEEIQLLAVDFSTMLFETTAPLPGWRDYYLSHDQTSSYQYLVKILKALQWLRGGTRWVLKSPQHLEQFPVLRATFPDATFVVTHRDPAAVTASMATMIAYTARMSRDRVDVAAVGRYWADRLERMLRSCAADRDGLPAARTVDVVFEDFMADDVATVERIYRTAGQPFDGSVRAAMTEFMAAHPRGRHGTVRYDLRAFGLDPGERRQALAFYYERFGLRPEG